MASLKSRGDAVLTLNGTELALQYRTRNMMKLSELTGKSPIALLAPLDGMDKDDAIAAGAKLCDFNLIVNLLVAGLAHHPEYRRTTDDALTDKVCRLIDLDCDKNNKSLFQAIAEIAAVVFPAMISSMNVEVPTDQEDGGQGNDTEPRLQEAAEARE